uniref:Preprotein translocase subunit SECE1 n=1 Tax=Noccaea caerulescens TaxID=107243 RepID=A0A1J3IKU0_NOCCA
MQRMVVSPGLLRNGSGLIRLALPQIVSNRMQKSDVLGPSSFKFSRDSTLNGRVSYNYKHVGGYCTAVSVGSPSFNEELPEDPLWLSLVRSTRSLLSFMAEQPRQLKFIEWPSFTSTLKTATLSLFLVAVFIVALSSVDSALCYILALILRKSP